MEYTNKIIEILKNYENTNAGIKANLGRILMHGDLGGTGKLVILPVDQGHEHGPDKSFLVNPPAYDPEYHYKLAIEAKLSAYAAPYGFLEAGAESFAGQIPTILKINSSNSLISIKNQSNIIQFILRPIIIWVTFYKNLVNWIMLGIPMKKL